MILGGLLSRVRSDVALRSGLVSALATLIALLLLAVIIWFFVFGHLETRVEESLVQRHEISLNNNSTFTTDEHELFQRFRITLPIRDEGVFAWFDNEGKEQTSNVLGLECREGFYRGWIDITKQFTIQSLSIVPMEEVDPNKHDEFIFLANKRGERCLVFGRSLFEINALRESALGLFAFLIPLCLIPALLIGFRHSIQLRQRLREVGAVVREVAGGDLDARIPVEGNDDIDRLANTANLSFDRLRDSVNTLQQLTSVIAHDLRAPLNRVAIPLEEAILKNEAGDTAVETLHDIRLGLEDARSVFDALLRISQIESGKRRKNFEKIDLYKLAEEMFEIYQPVIEESERTLEFEVLGEGASTILGDSDLIRQALVNLIENSMRYTPEHALIWVCVTRDRNKVTLSVRDNGHGVPESERSRVLERLYRFEGSTQGKSGHGLGLSLVKAVVDVHEGEIELSDAEPGLLVTMEFAGFS